MPNLYYLFSSRENDISTNRGNDLLLKLLVFRYPLIIGDVQLKLLLDYLAANVVQQGLLIVLCVYCFTCTFTFQISSYKSMRLMLIFVPHFWRHIYRNIPSRTR